MNLRQFAFIAAAALLAGWTAAAQSAQYAVSINPEFLPIGAGPAELSLSSSNLPTGLIIRWNGKDHAATSGPSPYGLYEREYRIKFSAEELAVAGRGELSLVDPQTGRTVRRVTVPSGYDVRPLDIVFDSGRSRYYITTNGEAGDARFPPNAVVTLTDADRGVIGPIFRSNSGPVRMALSPDGKSLFVAYDSEGIVRQIDAETFKLISEFRFRPAVNRTIPPSLIVASGLTAIAVMPGSQVVALSFAPDPGNSSGQLAVFASGVRQGEAIALDGTFDTLLFSEDGKYVFAGTEGSYVGTGVWRYSVDATGFHSPTPGLGSGPVTLSNGILFTKSGTVLNGDAMGVIGTLGVTEGVSVDPALKRVFAMNSSLRLQAYDLESLQPLGSEALSILVESGPRYRIAKSLTHFSTDGFLFYSSNGLRVLHSALTDPAPSAQGEGIVNAASQRGGQIAPGEIVSIYGTHLGPDEPVSATLNPSGKYDSELSDVQVWFDNFAGTVLLAYNGQINVIAPFGIQPGSTTRVQVLYRGIPSARIPVAVVDAAPAMFTRDGSGKGFAAVINGDGTINASSTRGGYVTLFGTGGGKTPKATDATLARSADLVTGTVTATIGGQNAQVLYAGAAPFLPNGVLQVNLRVPDNIDPGVVPVIVNINGHQSPAEVTLEIR